MKDIQNLRDDRRIGIRKVGVRRISYPVTVLDKARQLQQTVATVNMYVNLPHRFKGTHMSRFVEILNRFHGEFNLHRFHQILQEMKNRLDAEAAHLEIAFPYFLQQSARTGSGVGDRYECSMHGSLDRQDDLVMEIQVPITLPRDLHASGGLPRSIGRWGTARVSVRFNQFVWIEDLIKMIEEGLACREKLPDSVESACRQLAAVLAESEAIGWFRVIVENLAEGYATFASIQSHQHEERRGEE